jgi:hypothetical protein
MKQLKFKVLPLLITAAFSQPVLAGNWGAHWSMDRHGQDSSGRHHATAFASGAGSFDLGRKEQALYFDMLKVDSLSMQQVNVPASVSLWAIREATGLEETLLAKRDSANGAGFSLQLDSADALVFTLKNNLGKAIKVKSSWRWQDLSQWHHVVVSYNGSMQASGVQLFVDNQLVALTIVQNDLTDSQTTAAPLVIGADSMDGIAFSGSVDEVYLVEQSLNAASIDCLFALRDACLVFDNEEAPGIGEQGPRGFEGPKGPKGLPGPVGKTGDTGPVGLVGDKGLTGDRGPKGDKGPLGPTGNSGKAGVAGRDGINGRDGVNGLAGPQGPQGADGAQGDKGARGDKGGTGAQGDQGPQGLKGASGAKGLTGIKGPTGDTGADGLQGLPGDDGSTGLPGAKGATGPKGVTGPKGPTGPQGPTGDKGPDGLPPSSMAGATGPEGPRGPTGFSGGDYYYRGGGGGRYPHFVNREAAASPDAVVVGTQEDFKQVLKKYQAVKAELQQATTAPVQGEQQ